MKLSIRHRTHYSYTPAPARAALRLKLHPPQTTSQMPGPWKVTINGTEHTPLLTDPLGNRVVLWNSLSPMPEIEIISEGTIETTDTTGVLGGLVQMSPPGVFLRTSPLAKPDEAIRAIADGIEGDSALERLHMLSAQIHAAIDYRAGVTDATTTAAEATALSAGVCQDQAHVFIAAARSMGVPARYVTGYMADFELEDRQGEASHAWAEAWVPGLGWTGFDITNQLCPTDAYVRIATGFDAEDAAPVRGVLGGDVDETLETEVIIEQASGQSQQQQ